MVIKIFTFILFSLSITFTSSNKDITYDFSLFDQANNIVEHNKNLEKKGLPKLSTYSGYQTVIDNSYTETNIEFRDFQPLNITCSGISISTQELFKWGTTIIKKIITKVPEYALQKAFGLPDTRNPGAMQDYSIKMVSYLGCVGKVYGLQILEETSQALSKIASKTASTLSNTTQLSAGGSGFGAGWSAYHSSSTSKKQQQSSINMTGAFSAIQEALKKHGPSLSTKLSSCVKDNTAFINKIINFKLNSGNLISLKTKSLFKNMCEIVKESPRQSVPGLAHTIKSPIYYKLKKKSPKQTLCKKGAVIKVCQQLDIVNGSSTPGGANEVGDVSYSGTAINENNLQLLINPKNKLNKYKMTTNYLGMQDYYTNSMLIINSLETCIENGNSNIGCSLLSNNPKFIFNFGSGTLAEENSLFSKLKVKSELCSSFLSIYDDKVKKENILLLLKNIPQIILEKPLDTLFNNDNITVEDFFDFSLKDTYCSIKLEEDVKELREIDLASIDNMKNEYFSQKTQQSKDEVKISDKLQAISSTSLEKEGIIEICSWKSKSSYTSSDKTWVLKKINGLTSFEEIEVSYLEDKGAVNINSLLETTGVLMENSTGAPTLKTDVANTFSEPDSSYRISCFYKKSSESTFNDTSFKEAKENSDSKNSLTYSKFLDNVKEKRKDSITNLSIENNKRLTNDLIAIDIISKHLFERYINLTPLEQIETFENISIK